MRPRSNISAQRSPRAVTDHISRLIAAIEKNDGVVRAFCDTRFDGALTDANAQDSLPEGDRRLLHGTGIAIKEIFDIAGLRCAWGSPIHADRVPEGDCELVERLKHAGAIVLGTVASTEYAMAREAPTTNPHDPARSPGASSSGAAAAVAAGMADVAIGSQTIGSGIRPAAYCGVIGFKPTHGLISLQGTMPLSDVLDHAVIFGSRFANVSRNFEVLSDAAEDVTAFAFENARIAVVEPWFGDEFDSRTWPLITRFADALPSRHRPILKICDAVAGEEERCLGTILSHDMWRHHNGDYARSGDLMSATLKGWLERGRLVSQQDYQQALGMRKRLQEFFWQAAADVDVVVTVATTGVAPLLLDGTGSRAPQRLWTLLGCPALTLPIGTVAGLPVGVQLISRPGTDRSLLDFADNCEKAGLSRTIRQGTPAR